MKQFLVYVSVTAALFISRNGFADSQPECKLLWPHGAPGATGDNDADKPGVWVYPAKGNPNGAAIVICTSFAPKNLGSFATLSRQKLPVLQKDSSSLIFSLKPDLTRTVVCVPTGMLCCCCVVRRHAIIVFHGQPCRFGVRPEC